MNNLTSSKAYHIFLILIGVLLITASIITLGFSDYVIDDLRLVFERWVKGDSVVLVKLNVAVPKPSGAESCIVVVERFPSKYDWNNGSVEKLYAGIVEPGGEVVVRKYIPAVPVKVEYDRLSGDYKVLYYEPQEFIVRILCYDDDLNWVYLYSKIHEVYPTDIVTHAVISPDVDEHVMPESMDITDYEEEPSICDIQPSSDYQVDGYCITWVRLAYVNSIEGLEADFELVLDPDSAMYLEAYGQTCFGPLDIDCEDPDNWSGWYSEGKKLVPTHVAAHSDKVPGGEVHIVEGNVRFHYDESCYSDPLAGVTWCWRDLYPVTIGGLASYWYSGYDIPDVIPVYAYGPFKGDLTIKFEPPYTSDITIGLATGVTFTLQNTFSVTLWVDVYKSGRDDEQYTTPRLNIYDVSGSSIAWYYYWYKDDDPMSYEVELSS